MGRGNQYIHLVKVLYCKLPTISKQLATFPQGVNPRPQRGVCYHCATVVAVYSSERLVILLNKHDSH